MHSHRPWRQDDEFNLLLLHLLQEHNLTELDQKGKTLVEASRWIAIMQVPPLLLGTDGCKHRRRLHGCSRAQGPTKKT